jgi:sulfur-oxidizing protein SoxY
MGIAPDQEDIMPGYAERRRLRSLFMLAVAVLALAGLATGNAKADQSEANWDYLRGVLFEERAIEDGSAVLRLSAPYRAEDPAIVPIGIEFLQPQQGAGRIRKLTLIVDENPAPVAAVFSLAAENRIRALETRLRINAYSFVRIVAELEDGSLHMVKSYVKATGGCAAPASRNHDDALAAMGEMRLRQYEQSASPAGGAQFQLQIRHPNYSGLQMNQLTGHYRAAHYVETISISADGEPVMSVEGAISLSENPALRFTYAGEKPKTLVARIRDTEGNAFDKSWDVEKTPGGKDS